MCEFLNAIFLLNFENFEKILFDQSVVPKMEWEKPPRSLILENDVFVDTLISIQLAYDMKIHLSNEEDYDDRYYILQLLILIHERI